MSAFLKVVLFQVIVNFICLAEAFTSYSYTKLPSRNSHCIQFSTANNEDVENVDIAIVGAGIGGLCSGAILNTLYNKKVGIYGEKNHSCV